MQARTIFSHLALCLLAALLAATSSCAHLNASSRGEGLSRYEFTQPQMGVMFRIALYATDASTAKRAAAASFSRIKALNAIMSDYEFDSELSQLSRTSGQGTEVPVSAELWDVLERSQRLARRTDGAFDVTVGPCVNLWRRARRSKQMPEPEHLEEARKAVGYQNLRLDSKARTSRLLVPGMRLDLGGIAKGYAVDQALKVLRARGIDRALVAGDGDIGVSGSPPGKPGWRIAIATLDVPNAPTNRYVQLRHAAISTSGDLSQRLEIGGMRYSHIINPHTGVGLTDHSLVTVIARDSTTADSLATAISVLGPEKGLRLIKETPGTAVRIVRSPADRVEIYESSRFKRFFAEERDERSQGRGSSGVNPDYRATEDGGQASSLPVHGASSPRLSGGKMPSEPADKMSAPQVQVEKQKTRASRRDAGLCEADELLN